MSSEVRSDTSVEFLQKEHTKTLKGLHGEITRLQQKCAKLTFELTMAGPSKDHANSDKDNTIIQMLEKELLTSKETESVLQSKVEALESQIALQKHEKNLLLQKYEVQINNRDSIIMSLHSQIEEKSNTVAQLVHRMHQMQRTLQRGGAGGGSSHSLLTQHEQTLPIMPPKEPPPSEGVYRFNRISRRVRKTTPTKSANDSLLFNEVNRDSSGSLPSVQFYNSLAIAKGNGRSLSHGAVAPPTTSSRLQSGKSSDELHQLDFSLEDKNESIRSVNNHPTKTVLPPIISTDLNNDQVKLPPIVVQPSPDINKLPATQQRLHQRFHLAKTQGLTSAPPCPIRFTNYGGKSQEAKIVETPTSATASTVDQSDNGLLMIKHETSKTMFNHLHHQQESK